MFPKKTEKSAKNTVAKNLDGEDQTFLDPLCVLL